MASDMVISETETKRLLSSALAIGVAYEGPATIRLLLPEAEPPHPSGKAVTTLKKAALLGWGEIL